jgi:hypothetical protein
MRCANFLGEDEDDENDEEERARETKRARVRERLRGAPALQEERAGRARSAPALNSQLSTFNF